MKTPFDLTGIFSARIAHIGKPAAKGGTATIDVGSQLISAEHTCGSTQVQPWDKG